MSRRRVAVDEEAAAIDRSARANGRSDVCGGRSCSRHPRQSASPPRTARARVDRPARRRQPQVGDAVGHDDARRRRRPRRAARHRTDGGPTRPAEGRPARRASRSTCAVRSPCVNVAPSMCTDARLAGSTAAATSASARPVSPPPQGFSRGWLRSMMATRAPARASRIGGPRTGRAGARRSATSKVVDMSKRVV